MTAELFDFNSFKKKWEDKRSPELIPPTDTFEINKEYFFDTPVKSDAFYNKERTVDNLIGSRLFQSGKCLKYLKQTNSGPLFLFSGKLTDELNTHLNDIEVFFGVIYNTTDPTRSHAIKE